MANQPAGLFATYPIHRTHHRITCHGGIYVYYICIYIVNVLYIKHHNTLKYNMYCNMLSCHIMLPHNLSDCKWSRLARPSACSRWSILNRTRPQLCRLSCYPGMFSGWAKHFPGDRVFRRCRGVRMLVPWSKIIKSTEKMTLLDCHMLEAILSTWKIYDRLWQWYQRILALAPLWKLHCWRQVSTFAICHTVKASMTLRFFYHSVLSCLGRKQRCCVLLSWDRPARTMFVQSSGSAIEPLTRYPQHVIGKSNVSNLHSK